MLANSYWGYTRDVRKELLISIWRLQISSKPKRAHSMPLARNAKLQPMYPLPEGVTVALSSKVPR